MPHVNVDVHYVAWIPRGRRHHGSAEIDIAPPAQSQMSPGDHFIPSPPSPSWSWVDSTGPHTGDFAFWSVTRESEGSSFYVPPDLSQPDSPTVTVGQEDTVIKAWYIARGDGPPGAGVLIDAFDVNQGTFVDDDFVTVAPDSTLTAAANADGFVPTTAPEIVSASHLIEYVPFYDWTIVAGTETINHEDLQTAAQSSAIAFAFYWAPHGLGLRPPRRYEVGIRIYAGVTNDGPGLTDHGPVGPWYPFVAQFAAGLALADAASLVSPELKANVLDIAARQVSVAAGAIMQQMQIGTKKAG